MAARHSTVPESQTLSAVSKCSVGLNISTVARVVSKVLTNSSSAIAAIVALLRVRRRG
jgi:hypothetical protein